MEGFVPLSRRFFGHFLWCEDRSFSKAEAWIDMIQMAAFRGHGRLIGTTVINVDRGGIVASERFLSIRWSWSRTKVRDFIGMLQEFHMITLKKDHGISIISLCNFDQYNSDMFQEKPQKDQEKTTKEPVKNQEKTKENKGNKEEQGKEEPPTPKGGEPTNLVIPSSLNSEGFLATWAEWIEFRRTKNRVKNWNKLFQKTLDWLAGYPTSTAIAIINQSLRNGWIGLFELKNDPRAKPGANQAGVNHVLINAENWEKQEAHAAKVKEERERTARMSAELDRKMRELEEQP